MISKDAKFTQKLAEIYKELEPSLLAIAYRYRAPNPRVAVEGWQSRAYEIVDRMDKGELNRKVYVNDENQEEMEDYNPSEHEVERFIYSLKNYLKQSFANDLLKAYEKRKRTRLSSSFELDTLIRETTSSYSKTGFSGEGTDLMKYDSIRIDSLIKIIKSDAEKMKNSQDCVLDVVQYIFVSSLLNFCNEMKSRGSDWETMIVVPDIEENDNKRFFSYDFRSELEDGIRKQICKFIIAESSPIVIQKLAKLVDNKSKSALQKRLYRYLYEYRKGIPSRLRTRLKNKTL